MATRSSILAWRISWTEEPGGLQSMGSQRAHSREPPNQPQQEHVGPVTKAFCSSEYQGQAHFHMRALLSPVPEKLP